MPTLEKDHLVFRFPKIEERAKVQISFNRTLRVPDDGPTYPLPSGLGRFAVRHVEDYSHKLASETVSRGGVILPMWQSEAMWLDFYSWRLERGLDFPVAIKIAAGKINAVSGEPWRHNLSRSPQDYVVAPPQPVLDGFAVDREIVRQFVATSLGEGISVEEQLTDCAEWGGIQILVVPLKFTKWEAILREWEKEEEIRRKQPDSGIRFSLAPRKIGLTGGGNVRQQIYVDPFDVEDWDMESAERVFVSIVHAKDWFKTTGENNPNRPFTAASYIAAKLPWFEYCDKDQQTLPGSMSFENIKSIGVAVKDGIRGVISSEWNVGNPRTIKVGPKGIDGDNPKDDWRWDR